MSLHHYGMGIRNLLLWACLTLMFLGGQSSCFWKLWSKDEPIEKKVFDIYGTVEVVTKDRLSVKTKQGPMDFALVDSSIKGGEFEEGAYVHVYYKIKGEVKEVTMVVEKVDD